MPQPRRDGESSPGLRLISANSFRMFFVKFPQNRHPERSASQIYRVTERLSRGVEGPRRCLSYPCCSDLFDHLAQRSLSLNRFADDPVPKGRLRVAQDAVLGRPGTMRSVPSGTAEHMGTGFQPYLTDSCSVRQTLKDGGLYPKLASTAAAIPNTRSSSNGRPAICTPIGKPSGDQPTGTTAAGAPSKLNHCV